MGYYPYAFGLTLLTGNGILDHVLLYTVWDINSTGLSSTDFLQVSNSPCHK